MEEDHSGPMRHMLKNILNLLGISKRNYYKISANWGAVFLIRLTDIKNTSMTTVKLNSISHVTP